MSLWGCSERGRGYGSRRAYFWGLAEPGAVVRAGDELIVRVGPTTTGLGLELDPYAVEKWAV